MPPKLIMALVTRSNETLAVFTPPRLFGLHVNSNWQFLYSNRQTVAISLYGITRYYTHVQLTNAWEPVHRMISEALI